MEIRSILVLVACLTGCGQGIVEANGPPSQELSASVGKQFELTLHTTGPGEYASPPALSSAVVRFVDVQVVPPYLPSGPNQRFRFQARRLGDVLIEFHHTEGNPTISYLVLVR